MVFKAASWLFYVGTALPESEFIVDREAFVGFDGLW
jgi:hypothetical protein